MYYSTQLYIIFIAIIVYNNIVIIINIMSAERQVICILD